MGIWPLDLILQKDQTLSFERQLQKLDSFDTYSVIKIEGKV